MRKRGLIFILAAIPAWAFFVRFFDEARKSPFAYELGSMAFPVPRLVRSTEIFAVLATLIGICLVALDFIHWVKKKKVS
jgi:hypothetical protein